MSVLARDTRPLRFDRYLLDRLLLQFELTPLRVTLLYVLLGFSALYFSDVILVRQLSEPLLSQMQAVKGVAEVILTGAFIFGLMRTKQAQVDLSNEKVGRQQEELLVLHRVLRHNLRNDLNIIMGRSEMLKRSGEASDGRRQGAIVLKTAKKMLRYTEQAERIRRVTARNGHVVEMDLVASLPPLVETHPSIDDHVEVNLDLPESAVIRTNHMFLEAIGELIQNAVKHNDSDSPRIEISVDPTEGPLHHVELRITDNGPGIPDRVVSILEQSEIDQLTHLQGMGIWFVYWAIAESDGHMIIEKGEDDGATVRVRIPSADVVSKGQLAGVKNEWLTSSR